MRYVDSKMTVVLLRRSLQGARSGDRNFDALTSSWSSDSFSSSDPFGDGGSRGLLAADWLRGHRVAQERDRDKDGLAAGLSRLLDNHAQSRLSHAGIQKAGGVGSSNVSSNQMPYGQAMAMMALVEFLRAFV